MIAIFKNKSVGFFVNLATAVLTLLSLILYSVYCFVGSVNGWVIAALIAALVLEAVEVFMDKSWTIWLKIAKTIMLALALGIFVSSVEVVLSFTDYIFKIDYWGNADLVSYVITAAVFMILSIIAAVVGCFFENSPKPIVCN